MSYDQHANFAVSTVKTAPTVGSPNTISIDSPSVYPSTPFNAIVCPKATMPLSSNSTIVRVTDITGDVITFTRQQEGSNDRVIVKGDYLIAGITAKTIKDIEDITTALRIDVDANSAARHTHDNKSILDSITSAFTTALKTAYDAAVAAAHSHSNKSALDLVSGTNTGDQDLSGKVDKVTGKGLSAEDYTSAEKTKLAGIETGATVGANWETNVSNKPTLGNSSSKDVGTETGTVAAGNHAHGGVYEPANANIQTHISTTGNPHSTSKSDLGLGNVDNTSDANKPVSIAQAAAIAVETNRAKNQEIFVDNGKVLKPSSYGYIYDNGTLFEDFESTGDWTISGTGASLEADTINFRTGTQGIKLNSVNGSSAYMTKTINKNFSANTNITLWIYIYDVTKMGGAILLYLGSTTNISTMNMSVTRDLSSKEFTNGWNRLQIPKSDFVSAGGESFDNTMIRMRLRCLAVSGQNASITFDSMYTDQFSRPKCIISFDDGASSLYSEAYNYMATKGLKGTAFVPMTPTRIGQSGFCTLAQLKEMYNAGWDIGGHSYSHVDYTTLTIPEAESEMITEIKALIDAGFIRSAYHQAWPFSAYNSNLIASANKVGMKSSRTGESLLQSNVVSDYQSLCRYEILTSLTLTDYQTVIDNAISRGKLVYFNLHKVVTPTSQNTDITVADFQALIDYIKTKVDADLIDVVTTSEWYQGISGLATGDIRETPNKRFVTDAQLTTLGNQSGTNTGDETATSKGTFINGLTEKTTPVDADMISLMDSAASNILKKLSWSNIKATLKTYLDTLYLGIGAAAASCSGNAATSTKIATPVNINGVPFDGSANINPIYWQPSDHGLITYAYDPSSALNTIVITGGGLIYVVRVYVPKATNITNIHLFVTTAGNTLTSGQCLAGIYQDNTLLGTTADQSTAWASTGFKTMAISGGPVAVAAGYVDIAFFGNGSTLPTLSRGSGQTGLHNANLSAANSRFATADNGRTTSLPLNLGTKTQVNVSIWAALS